MAGKEGLPMASTFCGAEQHSVGGPSTENPESPPAEKRKGGRQSLPTPGLAPSETTVSRARMTSTPQTTDAPQQRKRTCETDMSKEVASTPPASTSRSSQQPQSTPAKKGKKDQSHTCSNMGTGHSHCLEESSGSEVDESSSSDDDSLCLEESSGSEVDESSSSDDDQLGLRHSRQLASTGSYASSSHRASSSGQVSLSNSGIGAGGAMDGAPSWSSTFSGTNSSTSNTAQQTPAASSSSTGGGVANAVVGTEGDGDRVVRPVRYLCAIRRIGRPGRCRGKYYDPNGLQKLKEHQRTVHGVVTED